MVVDALLRAVATTLRTDLSVSSAWIDVMPDGRPKPSFGSWFIAVYGGKFRLVNENSNCIRGSVMFHLTMTMRTSAIPQDRGGTDLTAKNTTGMVYIFETAIRSIHQDATNLVQAVNTAISKTGIESAPILISADFEPKRRRGGGIEAGGNNWLNAENNPDVALTMEAEFKSYINMLRSSDL